MGIWTETELNTQIAAYKQAMLSLATAKEVEIDTGTVRRKYRREDLPQIRTQLQYLQSELMALQSAGGLPVAVLGRPGR